MFVLLLCLREHWQSIVMSTSVCLSVCLSTSTSPERHLIFTSFSVRVAYGRGSVLLRQGDEIPRAGALLGVVRAIRKHRQFSLQPPPPHSLQEIIQLPITSCSRRDHCQASAIRNPENSERMRCGLLALTGLTMMGVHSAC